MPPKNYNSFWDQLMAEQGVVYEDAIRPEDRPAAASQSPFNVGDVVVGEIVEEQ